MIGIILQSTDARCGVRRRLLHGTGGFLGGETGVTVPHARDTDDILRRMRNMEAVQNRFILERDDVAKAISVCLVNRSHLLLVGLPGIAKTTQVRLVASHVRGCRFFYTQLTPFSTVEDLFGPVDIAAYKEGIRRRVGTGMLQEAHIAVIDEIYNGNEAVLKALLSPMYERVYAEQGSFHPIPLRTLMGTTNSVPSPEERQEKGLTAFHDRWLFRFVVEDIKSDANFMRMLWTPDIDFHTYAPEEDAVVTVDELEHLARVSEQVRVPVSVYEQLAELRRAMQDEAIYVSPRRWKQVRRALQTSALLDGRMDVGEKDFWLLRHTLWSQEEDMPVLERILAGYVRSVKDRVAMAFSRILEIHGEFQEQQRSIDSPADLSKLALDARLRMERRIQELRELGSRSTSDEERLAVDQYLQRAYEHLKRLDEVAGL